jgi:hypothetical protein
MRTTRARIGVGAAVALAVSLAFAGCGSDDERSGAPESSTTTAIADRSTTTAAPASVTGGDSSSGGSSGGDASAGGSSSGGSSGSGGGASTTPEIEEFGVPATVDCSGDDPRVSLTWSTRSADRVTISVDGPGVYAEYGPSGETAILFPCPGPHTYLLTAYGPGGATRTETVTVTGENVPPAGEGGDSSTSSADGSGGN